MCTRWCAHLCLYLQLFLSVWVLVNAGVVEQTNSLVLGLDLGAPNSVAAKVRSAAVLVNDV